LTEMSKKKDRPDEKMVQATLGEVVEPNPKNGPAKTKKPDSGKPAKLKAKQATKPKETKSKKEVKPKDAKKTMQKPAKESKQGGGKKLLKAIKAKVTRKAVAKKTAKVKAKPAKKEKKKEAKAAKVKVSAVKKPAPPEPDPRLKELPGVGDKLYERLIAAKYLTVDQISRARPESLSKRIEGLSLDGAKRLVSSAKSLVNERAETPEAAIPEDDSAEGPRLSDVKGIGPKLARKLADAGYNSVSRLSRAKPESLVNSVSGLNAQKAAEIIETARDIVRKGQLDRISTEETPAVVIQPKPAEVQPEPEIVKDDKPTKEPKAKMPEPKKEPIVQKRRVWKTPTASKDAPIRKKPRRFKSKLPVPEPVTSLAAEMKKNWKRAEKTSATGAAGQETYEVLNLIKEDTMERLVDVAVEVLNEAMTTGRPAFEIPSRSADNIVWDEVRDLLLLGMKTVSRPYHSLASVVDATRTARVMEIAFQLLNAGLHATKRELYYSDVNLFRDQKYSDKIIEDVASMLQTTRDSIHVVAAARGSAMGRVVVRDSGDVIDLTKMGTGGWAITPFLDEVEIVESDAEFILLSEKDAAVMRLAEAKYWNRQPCIVLTGKGSGDMATRAFLKQLVRELEIPAFALVDSDPYGHYIYSVFLRGSKRLSYESPFIATPELKLLGVLSRDLDAYDVPKAVRIPMEPADIKRVKDMLKEPFVASNNEWVQDLELMLKIKEKAEIQAFAARSFEYLTDEYIPTKLETGDWI